MIPKRNLGYSEEQLSDFTVHIETLFEPIDIIEIRTFSDCGPKFPKSRFGESRKVIPHFEHLYDENLAGRGIFVGPAIRKSNGGTTDKDVDFSRVVWADLDHVMPEETLRRMSQAQLPGPTLLIGSGNGSHIYQRLDHPISPEEVVSFNKMLAQILQSDPKVVNASRMMRMPGFYNMKDPSDPKLVHIVQKEVLS